MATSFFLWPSAAQHKGEDGGDAALGEASPPPPPPPPPHHHHHHHHPASEEVGVGKAKVRKGGGARGKSGGPKRPPQRGLGIFQLEQLRLQERLNKTPELDPAPHDVAPLHFQQQVAPVAGGGPPVYGAPIAYSVGHPHLDCHLHRFRPMVPAPVAFAGAGAGSTVRSVLGDQYALDSYRRAAAAAAAGEARYRVGSPFPEPPSNQISQCLSDQCEFCARKKRLFGNNLSANLTSGADYFEMDLAAAMAVNLDCGCHPTKPKLKPKPAMEKDREVIKEFEFFPPRSIVSASNGNSWEIANRKAADPSSASSSSNSAAFASTPLDLSLKLSLT